MGTSFWLVDASIYSLEFGTPFRVASVGRSITLFSTRGPVGSCSLQCVLTSLLALAVCSLVLMCAYLSYFIKHIHIKHCVYIYIYIYEDAIAIRLEASAIRFQKPSRQSCAGNSVSVLQPPGDIFLVARTCKVFVAPAKTQNCKL